MKYKTEVIINNKVLRNYYYDRFTHPRQSVRKTIQKVGDKLNYYIILVVNDRGEVWSFAVQKDLEKTNVRPMRKYGFLLSKNNIDLIFTGNKTIKGFIL